MASIDLNLSQAVWRKASLSNGSANCVEVAAVTGTKDGVRQPMVAVRDSKNPDGLVLGFTRAEFNAFVGGVRGGEFDDLAS